MTKLPKELTPELLELVLNEEIYESIMLTNAWGATDNHLTYWVARIEPNNLIEHHINLDTLTRLMKEWMKNEECMLSIYYHMDTVAITIHINGARVYSSNSITNYTEFKAVLKATSWIAKEKGLL